ncbi:MAG: sialate O-acetylesterase [Phycisphaeraceae bacterium]|nr:sialate O-acetylesterase [Phycisphaeraceae bacterium]
MRRGVLGLQGGGMRHFKRILFFASAVLCFTLTIQAAGKPLKVYILAGQSNMQGQARKSTMAGMAADPATRPLYEKMMDQDGDFRVFEEIRVAALNGTLENPTTRNGPLTIGFGGALNGRPGGRGKQANRFGPEIAFGITMHEHLREPILLIKASWGGKNLRRDFLSPAGAATMDGAKTGPFYKAMCEHVKTVLADPGKFHPAYDKEAGYQIAGFVWFQGWNDQVAGGDKLYKPTRQRPAFAVYGDLLGHFIRDVRKEFDAPRMPFVIGVIGTGGKPDSKNPFREAMAAPASLPEFKGNVFAVHTAEYFDEKLGELIDRGWRWMNPRWDPEKKYVELAGKLKPLQKQMKDAKKIQDKAERQKVLSEIKEKMENIKYTPQERNYIRMNKCNKGYHYFGSAKMYSRFGEAFARAILEGQKQ